MATTPKPVRNAMKKHEEFTKREMANQGKAAAKKLMYKSAEPRKLNKKVHKMLAEGSLARKKTEKK